MLRTDLARLSTLTILAVLLVVGLTGCDPVTSPEADHAATNEPSKMRHAHLFGSSDGAGKVVERYEELITYTDFILGTTDLVLDVQRVVERYDAEEGVTVKRKYTRVFNGLSIHVDPDHVDRIINLVEDDNDIAWMEPDPKLSLVPSGKVRNFPSSQLLVSSLNKVQGHNTSTNPGDGKGTVDVDLYILDTGIDHADLNIVERIDFTADGQDLDITRVVERYQDTFDPFSEGLDHGTHVAGIAAAIDDSDALVGMAPGARIHDFRVLNDAGTGAMSSVIAALDIIEARKLIDPLTPVVVNLSFGADIGTTEYNALDEAVAAVIAAGAVVVVAAGNGDLDAATVTPAHVAEAITVGSTYRADAQGQTLNAISAFSNYGPMVDLFAQGEDVMSLSLSPSKAIEMSGTSMAAPLVAGAAALYLSHNPLATPQQVRDALLGTADTNVTGVPDGTTDRYLNASSF